MVLEGIKNPVVREPKLTAVSVGFRGQSHHFFLKLQCDEQGRARVPQHQLDRILESIGVRRGDTYTVG